MSLLDDIAVALGDRNGTLVAAIELGQIRHLDWEAPMQDTPDRTVYADVECRHAEPNEDTTYDIPCGWVGKATVECWADTREVLWVCPSGHENSEPWKDFN